MAEMETVFEKLKPRTAEIFHRLYREQFTVWGREFRTRGRKCAIEFKRRAGTPVILDSWGKPVQRGAWLTARVDGARVVIEPASDADAELIEKHVREMAPTMLN